MASIGASVISAQAVMTTSKIAAIAFFPMRIQAWQTGKHLPVIRITKSRDLGSTATA
jgi:hypothetical protein